MRRLFSKLLWPVLALALAATVPPGAQAQAPLAPGASNFKNLVICGDFGTCPWQGGTSFTGITNGTTYTADQWFCWGGASSSISVSQVSPQATAPAGVQKALQFQRANSNSNTAQINCAQEFETVDVIPLQGQAIAESLLAVAGSGFTGTSVTASFICGTGTDEGSASLAAATWTGQSTVATATLPITSASSTWQTYKPGYGGVTGTMNFTLPATCTESAIEFSWTPVGTAGASDFIQIADVQVESNASATSFERRSTGLELFRSQRYYVQYNDSAAALVFGTTCVATSTTAMECGFALPVQMRIAPTPTWSATTSFGATCGSTANGAASSWAVVASSATTKSFGATATIPTTTAGFGCILTGKNTAANLGISARL